MRLFKLLFTCVVIFLCAAVQAQSPWTQPAKELYMQLSVSIIPEYNELYINKGDPIGTERQLQDLILQGWFEYGLAESSSILLIIPFKSLDAGELADTDNTNPQTVTGSLQSLGNVRLSFKQIWSQQTWIFTSHLSVDLPTAQYKDDTGLRSGYDALSAAIDLSAGRGFGNGYFYGYLGAGYRTNNYSSFITGGLEGGYQLADYLWVAGVIDILQSMQNGSREDPLNNLLTGFYVNNQEYLAWGVKAFGHIIPEKLGCSAAIYGAFSGNFVAKSPAINLGLFYIFSF